MSDPPELEAAPTFEAALDELQRIVHDLEEGRLGLETSLARFEQGVGLLKNCYRQLEQAEQRIEVLTGTDAQGNVITALFDATATIEVKDGGAKKPGRRRSSAKPAATPAETESDDSESDEQRLF